MNYDTAKLRQFINEFLGPQDLNDLLFDYFRSVHEDLTPGMTRRQQISLLLEFCHQYNQMPNLLAALGKMRPFFQPDDYVPGQKAPTAARPTNAPISRNPRQIFISHAHQDAEVAQRLAHDLADHGYDIWIAPDSIRPGEKWVEAINRGLEESSIFVLLLSPDAVASRWVKMETNAAIEFEHGGEIQFYPLMLKACRLPALWRTFHYISLQNGYEQGYAQLANLLKPETTPSPPAPRVVLRDIATAKVVKADSSRTKEQNSFVDAKTGKAFVRVSAGEFLYGDDKKKMYLDGFWMAKTPVTNAEYKRFLDANPSHDVPFRDAGWAMPYNWDRQQRAYQEGKDDHPVVLVSWHDAKLYAKWAGMELPTDEQWEKAARGTDGGQYPWGEEWRDNHCNTWESNIGSTTSVGQFSPQGDSYYGCIDMVGNVWEWTNVVDKEGFIFRALRGGSWSYKRQFALLADRYDDIPVASSDNFGFRVVVSNVSVS